MTRIPSSPAADTVRFWSAAELAERWGLSRARVVEKAQAGDIPAIKPGREWRFKPSEIEAFEARSRNGYIDPLQLTPGAARRRKSA